MPADDLDDLRRALENNEIVPFFQPLVVLRTGLLRGFEVLARWKHPTRGIIFPDGFIPLAEKHGLNGQLTGNLLRTVFETAKDIPAPLTLSVNISLTQLTDRTLPRYIRSAAERAGFPLERLILEITESALVGNPEQAHFIANQLKEQGSRLALDDFGTGYSSLRHLQALPFDELKIDASFVRSMTHARESRKIAAAIIGLGNSLDLVTVAEGIENQTHAEMLLWLGCEIGQGWLYGRAVPAGELPGMLAAGAFPHRPAVLPKHTDAGRLSHEALPAQRLAQLHAIYDGVPVGLCFVDRNQRYVSINKRLAEINNVPISHHLGRTVAEVVPHLYPQFRSFLERALSGEAITDIEVREPLPAAFEAPRTWMLSYQPARDEADEVVGVSVSVVDITERKRAEEALAESEDHYRHTVELNPQIPWTAEPNGMIRDVSHRWEKLTGIPKERSLGVGWLRSLHPEDVGRIRRLWERVVRTGEPIDVEYRVCNAAGAWCWMRSRAAPRRNADGEIVRWYGTVEDIDDYRKSQAALQRSEARLQAVFDAVPVGLVMAEAPGQTVLMSNPRAESILGRTIAPPHAMDEYRTPAARRPDGSWVKPHEYPLARAIQNGESTYDEEMLYRRADGSDIWISLSAAPTLGTAGQVTGGVVAIQDIDEQKREMERLRSLVNTRSPAPQRSQKLT